MCKISDQIKLCSCATTLDGLKNYWIFHRYKSDNQIDLMGETILPFLFPEKQINIAKLGDLLNKGDIFDVAIDPRKNDLLSLFFTSQDDEDKKQYTFIYNGEKWENEDMDARLLAAKYEISNFGIISHGLDDNIETNM